MTAAGEPIVTPQAPPFVAVSGRFFRAVAMGDAATALRGSNRPARFNRSGEATLYLSASRDGVAAAMDRYGGLAGRVIVAVRIDAQRIVDLRDAAACRRLAVNADNAATDWQAALAAGGEPASWLVADRLRAIGAHGVIDPSRSAPGLWHLALFQWDEARIER